MSLLNLILISWTAIYFVLNIFQFILYNFRKNIAKQKIDFLNNIYRQERQMDRSSRSLGRYKLFRFDMEFEDKELNIKSSFLKNIEYKEIVNKVEIRRRNFEGFLTKSFCIYIATVGFCLILRLFGLLSWELPP